VRRAIRELAGSLLWTLGLTLPERAGRGRLTVVTFHRVLPERHRREYPLPGLAVTPEDLAWFVDFFRRNYEIDTLARALNRWIEGEILRRPLLAITFDDGQADNHTYARPVLERAGVRASFFVPAMHVEDGALLWHDRLGFAVLAALERSPPGFLELLRSHGLAADGDPRQILKAFANELKMVPAIRREQEIERVLEIAGPLAPAEWAGMMSWEQLRDLARAGHEVGSHSLTHPILPNCSNPELDREVAGSKALLEERLQFEVSSFCYPNGDYDARVAAAVARAGYRVAVTTGGGPNRRGQALFELGRCDIVSEHAAGRDGLSETTLAWRLSGLYPGLR
jgi:peptidoglycan/xylan/chitin deacetylase (PgdA/CDA1 family)